MRLLSAARERLSRARSSSAAFASDSELGKELAKLRALLDGDAAAPAG